MPGPAAPRAFRPGTFRVVARFIHEGRVFEPGALIAGDGALELFREHPEHLQPARIPN